LRKAGPVGGAECKKPVVGCLLAIAGSRPRRCLAPSADDQGSGVGLAGLCRGARAMCSPRATLGQFLDRVPPRRVVPGAATRTRVGDPPPPADTRPPRCEQARAWFLRARRGPLPCSTRTCRRHLGRRADRVSRCHFLARPHQACHGGPSMIFSKRHQPRWRTGFRLSRWTTAQGDPHPRRRPLRGNQFEPSLEGSCPRPLAVAPPC